ncbi:hypothetical protein TCA2_4479 [Paenibacillus sp. TCA20]|uniref:Uncharacterized protein n=1 Tax=Paenibacillus urinalis TaxID=521520 RepID=A0ABY7XK80_9BACL|nr:hypothetical protein [Paenibacillus urinalis]WDI05186.1 hypothetical protein PUW25_25595 [Paenibacillus urinalis]GAK41987.1 hypothetical protein TCA2_4479 [Paenibacillus sp. TCA20]
MKNVFIFDDPEFQQMHWDFDPTGYEQDIHTYKPCGCIDDHFCLECVPF